MILLNKNIFGKRLLLTCVVIWHCIPGYAQKDYQVMDWKTDVTLNDYLLQSMHTQYDARRQRLAGALKTKAGTQAYIHSVRAKAKDLLGTLPARTPLQAVVTGIIREDGYKIEKLYYQSFPGHYVTANLYLPSVKEKVPAALFFCGHEDLSKATASYQQTAILFARNGFAALVIDPVSQSERHQFTDASGKPLTRGGTTEHTLLNAGANLLGTSVAADELWDNIRGLDYLVSRPEIDTARIGCLGNSGGGMQTIFFAAMEARVKVFAPVSYLSTRERNFELSGPADGCAHIPGEGAMGMELADYLVAAAPKPIMVIAGRYDFIDYTGTKAAFADIKNVYTTLGHPKKVALITVDDGHGISAPKRAAAVQWFLQWLRPGIAFKKEQWNNVLADTTLFAMPTGMVKRDLPGAVSFPDRNLERDSQLARGRNNFYKLDSLARRRTVLQVLGLREHTNDSISTEVTGALKRRNYVIEKIILRRPGALPLPVLVLYPPVTAKKIVVGVHEKGKGFLADSSAFIAQHLDDSSIIILPDLRGTGETKDRAAFNDPKYYNASYRNTLLSLHLGMPLVGQRVTDLQTVLWYIQGIKNWYGLPISLHAYGTTVTPAIHAAFLFPAFRKLYAYGGILSFDELLEDPLQKDQYDHVLPGVLRYYDIEQLAFSIGINRLHVKPYETGNKD